MTDETRYQKHKRTEAGKARHAGIVNKLTQPVEQEWEVALQDIAEKGDRTPCAKVPLPSPWTDWDAADPEPYESGRLPTKEEAEAMCAACPLTGKDGVCRRYAEATGQAHGIWGGGVVVNGKWVYDE